LKKKIFFGMIFFLLITGFIGCIEQKVNGNNDNIELVNYNVITKWKDNENPNYVEKNGFYHNIPENGYSKKYIISGVIKNIAGVFIDRVKIIAEFYDNNDIYLDQNSTVIRNLVDAKSEPFSITYNGEYFENIKSVKFEIITIKHD